MAFPKRTVQNVVYICSVQSLFASPLVADAGCCDTPGRDARGRQKHSVPQEPPTRVIHRSQKWPDSSPRTHTVVLAHGSGGRGPGRSRYQIPAHGAFSSKITWGKKDTIPFISVCCQQKHWDLLRQEHTELLFLVWVRAAVHHRDSFTRHLTSKEW